MSYRIKLLEGDGVGKEVISEGRKLLELGRDNFGLNFDLEDIGCGAGYYKEHGVEWEPNGFESCRDSSAILLGAVCLPGVTLPDGDPAGKNVLLGLRFKLDLFANVRPCKMYKGVLHKVSGDFRRVWSPENVNFTVVRENTEGMYSGEGVSGEERAVDNRVITTKGSERIIRHAFGIAEKSVTCVDKSNVMKGCRLFREVFDDVGKGFKVEKKHMLIDAMTQSIMREPEKYDVIVTTNMFGDILSDLATVLQGGMGVAPSANIGLSNAMFEPVHGSAPDIAGKNIVNPIATFLSIKMMVNYLDDSGTRKFGSLIEDSVKELLSEGKVLTPDLGGSARCSEVGEEIRLRMLRG